MLDQNYDRANARKFVTLANLNKTDGTINTGNALEQSAVEKHRAEDSDDDRLASLFKVRIVS